MACFTEENVAKNMDNIRDRWNEVNSKSLHVDKQTFIEKITPYCMHKWSFKEWMWCWFLELSNSILAVLGGNIACYCCYMWPNANEALWGRYQNWHLKFNILFNIWGTFWHKNCFHIIFLSKVIDNLISTCLITLKINYQDMGRQSYWFVHKPIEDIKNNWIKT